MPQRWGVYPICDPQDFLKNRALSLLYPYGALTSSKKLEKSLERSLRYLKTGHGLTTDRWTNRQGRLLRTPSDKPGVQNMCRKVEFPCISYTKHHISSIRHPSTQNTLWESWPSLRSFCLWRCRLNWHWYERFKLFLCSQLGGHWFFIEH